MYCKKCGCKLIAGNNICPECGSDSTDIEYCGGFWGLVGLPKQTGVDHPSIDNTFIDEISEPVTSKLTREAAPTVPKADMRTPDDGKTVAHNKGKKNKQRYLLLIKLISVLTFVIFVICLVQTIRLSSLSKKTDSYRTRYESVYAENQELKEQSDTQNQQYEDLNQQYEELKKQYEALSQENADLVAAEDDSEESSDLEQMPVDTQNEGSNSSDENLGENQNNSLNESKGVNTDNE